MVINEWWLKQLEIPTQKSSGEAETSKGILIRRGQEAGEGRELWLMGPSMVPASFPEPSERCYWEGRLGFLSAGETSKSHQNMELCLGFCEPG